MPLGRFGTRILARLGLASLLAFCCPLGTSQELSLSLDGERYVRKFSVDEPSGDKVIGFLRERESRERWTKMMSFRQQRLPRLDNDPVEAAFAMERVLKRTNPKAQSRITSNNRGVEAMIDFLTWAPGDTRLEFNVIRYVKGTGGKSVVSLQLTWRVPEPAPGGRAAFQRAREAWRTQAATFDMGLVQAAFLDEK